MSEVKKYSLGEYIETFFRSQKEFATAAKTSANVVTEWKKKGAYVEVSEDKHELFSAPKMIRVIDKDLCRFAAPKKKD